MITAITFLVAFVGLILLIAVAMPKKYRIVSEIVINRPKSEVFNYVKHIRNQEKYSKWILADPNIKITNKGTDGTVGFVSSWVSNVKNVGEGEQEIIKIYEGEGYDADLRFIKPFKGLSHAKIRTKDAGPGQTKFITTFDTKTDFPLNIMVPMIKKMLKKDMNENSANLKRILETV